MKTADQPFLFYTASDLVRICNQSANNLAEFRAALEQCSDASIFYHTFQTLGRHHFLTDRFSNDFAQWVLAACNRAELAERLAGLDIREYVSIVELRTDLARMVTEYCDAEPQFATQAAFEPFNFCESVEVTLPLGLEARTLEEFRDRLERLGHNSLHFHFISSRLRLHLRTNDFSYWISNGLGIRDLAAKMNRIDVYTNTLDDIQHELIRLVDETIGS